MYDAIIDDPNIIYFLKSGDGISSVSLPDNAYAIYSRFGVIPCRISWRWNDFDNVTTGTKTLVDDILLPTGYKFMDDIVTVDADIIVYEPNSSPTENAVSISTIYQKFTVPLGAGQQQLLDYFSDMEPDVRITLDSGKYFDLDISLDPSLINSDKSGAYFPFKIDIPQVVYINDYLKFLSTAVFVVPDNLVTLSCIKYISHEYIIQWIQPVNDPVLWMSIDGGQWSKFDTNGDGRFKYNDDGTTNEIRIVSSFFKTGSIY